MFKLVEVICDGPNFLVLRVQNVLTEKEEIAYVSRALDIKKDTFTPEDLQMITW